MSCIQNMPRIDSGARPDRYGPPPSGGETPPPDGNRQARQAAEETEVKEPSSVPNFGAPPISGEIVDYLCRYIHRYLGLGFILFYFFFIFFFFFFIFRIFFFFAY